MADTSEENQSLWLIKASPVIWAAHFGLCYATAAVYCAKAGGALGPVRGAILAYTLVALAAIAAFARAGWARHTHGHEPPPHDADTPEDRHRFLGYATLLLSGLSAVAVVYAGLVAAFFRTCR